MKKLAFASILTFFTAMGDGYFSVTDVEVRVQAKNSFVAQQKAQNSAMLKAFSKVLQKEFSNLSVDISGFTDQEVSSCLCDYSIDKEKFSQTVFVGKFSFRFHRDRVALLLKKRGFDIPLNQYAENVTRYVVLRSVFEQHPDLFWENGAKLEKFNSEKVIFSMDEESAEKIITRVRCVKL